MKLIQKLLLPLFCSLSLNPTFAETQIINFNGGYFYSSFEAAEINDYMTSGKILLVADMTGAGLSNITISDGSSVSVDSYLNGGNDYFVFGEATISSMGMSAGKASAEIEVDLSSPLAGKEYAIVILGQDSVGGIVSAGDSYGVFSPTFVKESIDKLSGGDDWVIPTDNRDHLLAWVFTESAGGEGYIPNEYLAMDKVVAVVPEPATCAFIFGAAALILAAYRRRK